MLSSQSIIHCEQFRRNDRHENRQFHLLLFTLNINAFIVFFFLFDLSVCCLPFVFFFCRCDLQNVCGFWFEGTGNLYLWFAQFLVGPNMKLKIIYWPIVSSVFLVHSPFIRDSMTLCLFCTLFCHSFFFLVLVIRWHNNQRQLPIDVCVFWRRSLQWHVSDDVIELKQRINRIFKHVKLTRIYTNTCERMPIESIITSLIYHIVWQLLYDIYQGSANKETNQPDEQWKSVGFIVFQLFWKFGVGENSIKFILKWK